jgi:hypothetical protein
MTDFQTHQISIDRSRPGIWTVSISNPPINMFVSRGSFRRPFKNPSRRGKRGGL